jgi:hypothetical protein
MKCFATNETLIDKVRAEERERAVQIMAITVAATALDKCGLCKNTVEKLLLGAVDKADSINRGYVKVSDLTAIMKEEYDFEIKFTGRK